jgi:predicted negative regulator of RcsB-dependent stress response
MGYYEEAKTWINKAIETDGWESPVILEHYGDALWKLNEKDEAVKWWIKAQEKGKGSEFLDKKVEDKILYE